MKIQQLIDYLQRNYAPDEAIVVEWWDRSDFETTGMTLEEWAKGADFMEKKMDWSRAHDRLSDLLNEYMVEDAA